ncbi:MAG: radical SAM protein [bacterium]|nr:radical SAM protein [bacterium]
MNKFEKGPIAQAPIDIKKFTDPNWTAKGEERAQVPLGQLETLWFNTGTLCNIECVNCYIESSPTNDRLSYITAQEVAAFLDEIDKDKLGTREIGFTGGEPFMNPQFLAILENTLMRGFKVLVLTNAMAPMQRKKVKKALLDLQAQFGAQLTLRISLDHYTSKLHDTERGEGSFNKTIIGIDWLSQNQFSLTIAGRTMWNEEENKGRLGYAKLVSMRNWSIDAQNPEQLILFPEMDKKSDVPEITKACWGILKIQPQTMMCATSRMIVKRRGTDKPQIVPCTLIAYEEDFDMGHELHESANADGGMFANGAVKLCHPYCAKFCVLGGGSCSV